MAIASYPDLQTSVIAWMNRGDSTVTSRVPDFIALAEQRIFETGEHPLRVSDMIKTATLNVVGGTNTAALPSDWLAFSRVRSVDEPKIEYMPAEDLADLGPPGLANVYTIEGRSLIYGQTPAVTLPLTISYYAKPDPLATTPTNWLLSKASSIYLYGALVEFALFTMNAAKAAEWGALFEKAINALESADKAAMLSGSRLRRPAPVGYGYRTR